MCRGGGGGGFCPYMSSWKDKYNHFTIQNVSISIYPLGHTKYVMYSYAFYYTKTVDMTAHVWLCNNVMWDTIISTVRQCVIHQKPCQCIKHWPHLYNKDACSFKNTRMRKYCTCYTGTLQLLTWPWDPCVLQLGQVPWVHVLRLLVNQSHSGVCRARYDLLDRQK